MSHVVVHKGEMSERAYRDYLRLVGRRLLAQGKGLDRVPRTATNGRPGRWLYVFADEAVARAVAEELKQDTEDEGWEVRPAEGVPEEGPLQPISVELCWQLTGFAFGLTPLTERALEARFPGCLRYEQVFVDADLSVRSPLPEEIRSLAADVLPLLVHLTPEVRQAFGGFEVIQPVDQELLMPFVPFNSALPR
jgi:hypothetical protein